MKVQFRLNKSNWHIFQLLLLLILFASLFSCAGKTATGKSEKQLEVVPLERAYENIFFDTFETTEIIKKDYPLAVIECQASAITWLNMKNVFSRVENIKGKTKFDDKTLLVKAEITEIRIVSGAARLWGGAFAGSSNINLKIKLIDASLGNVIREKELSSATNPFGAAWTMGASDRSLPSDMGKILAEYLMAVVPHN